ncbi:MAG: DNA methyltransferase [Nanoarchaeota archaeon]|nr:DNA methyltransferase [Nanoarchaeota archaeon]
MKYQLEKFQKLKNMEEQEIELSSVWNFGTREKGFGSHIFHGNCIPQVVKQCILRYSKEDDIIIDSMSGSGTTYDVAKKFKRKCLAFDINPQRKEIKRADSASLPVIANRVNMAFIHLPYWNMVKYSDDKEDLSRKKTVEEFYIKLQSIFLELRRVLKPKGHICVLVGDKIKDGKNIPLCFETYNLLKKFFAYKDYAVKITKHANSIHNKGKVVQAELAWNDLLRPTHDLLLVFQKM